jgi:hypothetical protein
MQPHGVVGTEMSICRLAKTLRASSQRVVMQSGHSKYRARRSVAIHAAHEIETDSLEAVSAQLEKMQTFHPSLECSESAFIRAIRVSGDT